MVFHLYSCLSRYFTRKGNKSWVPSDRDPAKNPKNLIRDDLLVAGCASLGYLTIGLVRGWSSPAVPSMEDTSPDLVPDDSAISWISAVPPLGAFMGSLTAGPLLQLLGRKGALLVGSPIFALAWAAVSFAPNTLCLILARAATGFSVGIVLPSAQVYVSECSQPKIRGRLGTMPALFMAGGILLSYLAGSFLPWDKLAILSATFPTLLFFLLLPLPESPAWLRTKGRTRAADEAAEWLRLPPATAQVELQTVEATRTAVASLETKQHDLQHSKAVLHGPYSARVIFTKPVMMPLLLVLAVQIFQQVSGIDTIIFYTVSIFQASGSSLDEYEATIVVGVVQLLATVVSIFLIDKFGRKPLLLFSGLVMFLSMSLLGWYFYLFNRFRGDGLGLMPLVGQICFIAGYSLGYANVPYILMGELLPTAQRGFFSSLAGATNLGSMFLVIKTYPDILNVIGNEGVFTLYAIFCLLSCFFVGFLLPETKGKSLEEIERIFKKENKQQDKS